MTSNFTEEEWGNIMRMIAHIDTRQLAVEILRNNAFEHEGDLYKAYFIVTQHRIESPTQGTRTPTVNHYWRLTEELKQAILKLKPWLGVNVTRTEDTRSPIALPVSGGRTTGNRYINSQQGASGSKKPIRGPLPAPKRKPTQKVLGPVNLEDAAGQHT